MPLSSSFSWLSLISKHRHPHLQQSNVIPALLDENEDSIDFVHVCITVMEALVLCCSGGQLINLVWGLVMGHHQPALCCCQEPFTPSISSPNGTSKSIKTIITANSTESKEIILGHQRKHGLGVWIYLSREQLDVHLARQPITVSIFCICLVWIHWWPQQGFFSGESQLPHNEPAVVWPCRCCSLSSLGGPGNLFSGKQKSMSDCVRLGTNLISGHVFTLTMV